MSITMISTTGDGETYSLPIFYDPTAKRRREIKEAFTKLLPEPPIVEWRDPYFAVELVGFADSGIGRVDDLVRLAESLGFKEVRLGIDAYYDDQERETEVLCDLLLRWRT